MGYWLEPLYKFSTTQTVMNGFYLSPLCLYMHCLLYSQVHEGYWWNCVRQRHPQAFPQNSPLVNGKFYIKNWEQRALSTMFHWNNHQNHLICKAISKSLTNPPCGSACGGFVQLCVGLTPSLNVSGLFWHVYTWQCCRVWRPREAFHNMLLWRPQATLHFTLL